MRTRYYSSEAIVLTRKNYSEADRILVIFSRDLGKLSLLAKGVRKLESRKRGHIEVFSHIKFSASRGKFLDIIAEVETKNSFQAVRKDLKKTTVAYFFMEVIDRIMHEGEKNEKMFDLLLNYLEKITEFPNLKDLRQKYIYDVLVGLGFWPAGKPMEVPDRVLEEVLERNLSSIRVGRNLLT